jgi:long-chain fatty acid transport protein
MTRGRSCGRNPLSVGTSGGQVTQHIAAAYRLPIEVLAATLLLAATATSQTNERIYEELDLRTVTPGARAVGMGKTFVGLADDATAAFSNPAGLSNLLDQEFSFEFQGTRIKHERLVPSDSGLTKVFGETYFFPSFISYAIPLGRTTISLFGNRVQDYRENFQFDGRFIESVGAPEDGAFGRVSIQAENYGVGLSFAASRFLSVGGSFVVSTINVASEGRSGAPLNPRNGTNTIDSGTSLSGIGGVLLKPRRNLSIGAAYYQGSTYQLETTLFGRFLERGADLIRTGEQREIEYVVPSRIAFGVSWRPTQRLVVAADTTWVAYSQQISDRFLIVDFMDSAAGLSRDNFFIRDVWEIHTGAEFRWYRSTITAAVRGGVFTEPDHRLRFRPAPNAHVAQALLDFRFNTVPAATDVGVTFGGGLAIRNHVQFDFAMSLSRDSDDFVVSAVVRP